MSKSISSSSNPSSSSRPSSSPSPSTTPTNKDTVMKKNEFTILMEGGFTQFIFPIIVMFAHMYFLYTGYQEIVGKVDPFGNTVNWYQPLLFMGGYLFVVKVLYDTRESRPSMEPKAAMFVYNVYETVFSAFMFYSLLNGVIEAGYTPFAFVVPVDRSVKGSYFAWILWIHYHSKYLEYFDTLFMLLRNKPSSIAQVNLLHVVHHAVMGPMIWLILAYEPGGSSYFGPCLNSLVHTVMYFYYFISSFGYQPWWKKYITKMQMTQFVLILIHALYHIYINVSAQIGVKNLPLYEYIMGKRVHWSSVLAYTEVGLMFMMLGLFAAFYQKRYNTPSSATGGTESTDQVKKVK